MKPKPEVYDQIWKANIAKSRKIETLEKQIANMSYSLERLEKRNAELEERLRAAQDTQHSAVQRQAWDKIQGVS